MPDLIARRGARYWAILAEELPAGGDVRAVVRRTVARLHAEIAAGSI